MPLGRTPITWNMTVRDALLNVINEDMAELFSRVEALELGELAGIALATEEEAVAGVDNTKAMTPLRVHQAIAANPSVYLKTADHTKALHDSLGINADTLDGHHSTAFRMATENVYLSQGQIVDFADEVGDKIRLYGTQYGVAINPDELTLYTPSTSEIAVRDSANNGQKLGEVIHTGNIHDKGVAKRISLIESTAGDFILRRYSCGGSIIMGSYKNILRLYIPWTGTMRYLFTMYSTYSGINSIYIKFNTTEHGPYHLPQHTDTNIYIDDPNTGSVEIYIMADYNYCCPTFINIQTGNVDLVYELMTTYRNNNVNGIIYPLGMGNF